MSRAVSPQNSLEIALENLGAKVSGDISAARHTTLAVGGPLRRFIEVPDEQVLANCLSILHREGEPFRAL